MGVLSVAFAAWMAFYFAEHPFGDPVLAFSGWAAATSMFAFGGYVLIRRWRHGSQA